MVKEKLFKKEQEIILAGGCFWGVSEYFSRLKGVISVKCLYIDGNIKNPTYADLKSGKASHAEAVLIKYNNLIDLKTILKNFLLIINPFSLNKQGNDIGIQYRSGVYYQGSQEKELILTYFKDYFKEDFPKIQIQIKERNDFYLAEEYHQDYLKKNKNGYCHIDFNIMPKEDKN
ncbi:MAG: peptide-methionine (S)-S-oxide reductase MsrA, partial [Bacillales bacterium]|jgi:methionine-S-sulfoxide reductase|nr:peptide-methionine (S)-S-oxide reductase MsrA [Bacillales bacterium]